jgi:hypothetical protein
LKVIDLLPVVRVIWGRLRNSTCIFMIGFFLFIHS